MPFQTLGVYCGSSLRLLCCRNCCDVALKEKERFNSLASQWWDVQGPFNPLHTMNHFRIPWILDKVDAPRKELPLKGFNVLDVGCGGGILSIPFAKLGACITGIDISRESIGVCNSVLDRYKSDPKRYVDAKFHCASVEDFAKAENELKFDIIIASEVVDHVNDVSGFVKACAEMAKPGGSIFVTTINRTIPAWLFVKFASEYILHIIPKGMHTYSRFVTPSELRYYLLSSGFTGITDKGILFNPFMKKWSETRFLGMCYGMHGIKQE